jgi:hypothetical protein
VQVASGDFERLEKRLEGAGVVARRDENGVLAADPSGNGVLLTVQPA